MQKIQEYIQLPLEHRQSHLDLSTSCSEIGGDSREFRGLLAYHVGCTIPTGERSIHLCHACHNGKCSNVKHLYWGTAKENWHDCLNSGRRKSQKGQKRNGYLTDKPKAATRSLSPEKRKEIYEILESIPREYGWIQRAADKLGVSHTQVRRYEKQRCTK